MSDTSENSTISLKALVDKGSNKIIFVECGHDFLDVLFSFLTFPMGTIIKLGRNHSVESVPVEIGCMKNLYASVENTDVQQFHNEVCRDKLLYPRNAAESHCKNLKFKIDNGESIRYFLCPDWNCLGVSENKLLLSQFKGNLLSLYKGTRCDNCGKSMDREYSLSVSSSFADQYEGVFVKGLARLIVSDDLQVLPPSSGASFSLCTKLGVLDGNTTEETFDVGINEVLKLLMSSFMSKTPLTQTLLKHEPEPKLSNEIVNQGICFEPTMTSNMVNEDEEKISVKLMISKSKKIVCYAEAGGDFVNLLFSFLTLPLGFILKQMRDSSWKGCIDQLYKSVQDLDDHYLKSTNHQNILMSPKLFPGFAYKNHLLGAEEGSEASYYYAYCRPNGIEDMLLTDKTLIPAKVMYTFHLKLVNDRSCQGFLKGATMFIVTDKLIVRPMSPIFGFSILNELKVPFADIKEELVQVGKEEALRLLVASFVGDSALTDVFIRQPQVRNEENLDI